MNGLKGDSWRQRLKSKSIATFLSSKAMIYWRIPGIEPRFFCAQSKNHTTHFNGISVETDKHGERLFYLHNPTDLRCRIAL